MRCVGIEVPCKRIPLALIGSLLSPASSRSFTFSLENTISLGKIASSFVRNFLEMPECAIITCRNASKKVNYWQHGITYHVFPKDPKMKEKWMGATGRGSSWFPYKHSTICSVHFKEEMYQPLNKSRRLFEWAVPKINVCQIVSDTKDVTESSASCSRPQKQKSNEQCSDLKSDAQQAILADFQVITTTPRKSKISDSMNLGDIETPRKREISDSMDLGDKEIPRKRKTSDSIDLGDIETTRKRNILYSMDSSDIETPRAYEMRIKLDKFKSMIIKQRTKIQTLQKKTSRYLKRISSLKSLVKALQEKNLVNSDQVARLETLGVDE